MKPITAPGKSRLTLEPLAKRVAARATRDKLTLPARQLATLRKIVTQGSRSPDESCCVLLLGPVGTAKGHAAQVLARELQRGLYRVDVAATVSKYIGETEKNINRLFTDAASSNVILLFDEADALFGKRTKVINAHDRYANLKISFLVQRLERYNGVVLLAAPHKGNLDNAFIRRCRFTVEFPSTSPKPR